MMHESELEWSLCNSSGARPVDCGMKQADKDFQPHFGAVPHIFPIITPNMIGQGAGVSMNFGAASDS